MSNQKVNQLQTKSQSNASFAWQYLKSEKVGFSIAIVFIVVNALLQISTPVAIQFVIDNAIKTANFTLLWQVIGGMCVIFIIEALIYRQQVIIVGKAAQRIMYSIRINLFGHLQKLDSQFFIKNQSGDLISKINSDTTVLDSFLGQYIFSLTSTFFAFTAFGIYLFVLNPYLATIAYSFVIVTAFLSLIFKNVIQKINTKSLVTNGEVKNYLADNLNNFQVIESFNMHKNLSKGFIDLNKQNQIDNYKSRVTTNIFNPIYNLVGNAAIFIILVIVVYFKFGLNPANIGSLIAFLYALVKFFQPMRELGTVFASLSQALSALTRIREILNTNINNIFQASTNEPHSQPLASNLPKPNSPIAIRFSNVSFSYKDESGENAENGEKTILKNVSFEVKKNSKIALIGATGNGKSTIAKLMSGLLIQNEGIIEVFGKPLSQWSQQSFYNTIGYILQDPFLFSGTVASNIIYGNPRYEDFIDISIENDIEKFNDSLIQALILDIKKHNLDEIIPNLDQFLKTEVNNNSQNISSGQKQIINFIRVLLREPEILILDEATANLDTITETYLQTALSKLNNKVTQIIIAHRQNTIRDADVVFHVGGGKVTLVNV